VSWSSECKERYGCGEEERWTGGRGKGSKRLIAKQETVGKEMSNEVKKMTKCGRMRCKNERYQKNIRKEKKKKMMMMMKRKRKSSEMTPSLFLL
jgi:hypothetical protein